MKAQKIIAITTITTIAAAGLANAQSATTTESHRGLLDRAKTVLMQKHKHNVKRKAIEDAILAGNFTLFQQLASTTPLKVINQNTFNLLVPQYQAKKNAEDQIKNILTSAGIKVPNQNHTN